MRTKSEFFVISRRKNVTSYQGYWKPNAEQLRIVTTNCGVRVEHLDKERAAEIFAELEPYGVRHEDAEVRNITYRQTDGRFCIIDFEFSTILPGYEEPANASAK